VALKETAANKIVIDAATFTSIRLIAGAIVLGVISALLQRRNGNKNRLNQSSDQSPTRGLGNWLSALALFAYAACFSFAYLSLSAATGALLLFGAVQTTMIGYGIWRGERLRAQQLVGLVLAIGGLVYLMLPGLAAPPIAGSMLMLIAGVAWGIYSLRGRGAIDPTSITAGNFLRAVPLTMLLSVVMRAISPESINFNPRGMLLAITSGAITSGLGYAIWYAVLPSLKATTAATVQLSVPVITALGAILFLNEKLDPRLIAATIAILTGIALVILKKK
jgi:drug/metabolite transporter (DMT)-like permease